MSDDFDSTMSRDPHSAQKREALAEAAGPISFGGASSIPDRSTPEQVAKLRKAAEEATLRWQTAARAIGILPTARNPLDAWQDVKPEWLDEDTRPPPRMYLLNTDSSAHSQGMLPLGKAGMLAAGGGVGKTMALAQLALSVAAGQSWLGTYYVANPGRVLLALGEEDAEEIHRRLWSVAQLMFPRQAGVDANKRAQVARNITILPMCGFDVTMTCRNPATGMVEPTPLVEALLKRLNDSEGWRLVILDPLSRFAGADAEVDNAAATRFVEVAERLTKAPGNPTVLVAHHTNKMSRNGDTSSTAARGASALTDGFRWQANLDSIPNPQSPNLSLPDCCRFRVTKNNYGLIPNNALWLVRDRDHSGALRPATSEEQTDYEHKERAAELEQAKSKARDVELRNRAKKLAIAELDAEEGSKELNDQKRAPIGSDENHFGDLR